MYESFLYLCELSGDPSLLFLIKGWSHYSILSGDPFTEWETSLAVKGSEMKIPS